MKQPFLIAFVLTITLFVLVSTILLRKVDTYKLEVQTLQQKEKTLTQRYANLLVDKTILEYKLNEDYKLRAMVQDLKEIKLSLRKPTLGLCFTESSLNYGVKHTSSWDKTTTGICGIKPELWQNVLEGRDPNSLYSGSLILEHLLKRFDNDLEKAIKYYKGSKKNTEVVEKALKTIQRL